MPPATQPMDYKIPTGLAAVTLLILAAAILIPGGKGPDNGSPALPWQIAIDAAGNASVFGLTLGRDTLAHAEERFQTKAEVSLFASPAGTFSVEAYFQRLYIDGIRADFVLTLDIDQAAAARMYGHGLRLSKMGSGTKKVSLAPGDLSAVRHAAISLITYLPAADLDEKLLRSRFGEPARRIREASGISHWLYPEKGLDIALNPDGKEVFQYTSPANFHRIEQPLQQEPAPPRR